MHRIDSDGHVDNLFVDEDANQAIAGTKMAADWLNAIQEELINILVLAGIEPSKADDDQLAEAFNLLGGSKDWADITNKPITFPPSAHTHMESGSIITMASMNVPDGYLECDGAAISRTTYSDLFAVCGTIHGVGDGTTTFNIPDLRGEFIRGWDHGRGVDVGRELGSAQLDLLKSHNHSFGGTELAATRDGGSLGTASLTTDTTDNTGGAETRPRNIALMYCIKY